MDYRDIVIEAFEAEVTRTPDKRRAGHFKVRVLHSPAGEMLPEQAVAVTYDEKQLQATLGQLERRELQRANLIALGRTLAMLLLPPKKTGDSTGVRELLATSLAQIDPDTGLRVRLCLPPTLAVLPWEYMYVDRAGGGEGMDGFLVLDPRVALVRHETLPSPAPLPTITGDIKVIVALASAMGLPELDLEKERTDLALVFKEQAGIQSVYLDDATLDEVQAAIPGAGIFHFAGHGVFTRQMGDLPGTYTGTGALALDDGHVNAEQLGINLQGNGVRLAVLGGCKTGRRDSISVWSGIAPALVKADIPAVVANQYTILDKCAIAFSRQFYRALVGGLSIERAVTAGRIAAYNIDPDGRDWGVPVLYLRAEHGRLFAGATDETVRQQAREVAEVDVNVRVREVAAGGKVLGVEVRDMLAGKLAIAIEVADTVYGEVVGASFDHLGGGETHVRTDVDTVGKNGSVTGVKLDQLG
ncbi:MAG: CHAT domain-containing protein [Anaerolineae bacterium]|nr:CHAT domain-containing protein [Anaerolineae bacterium]